MQLVIIGGAALIAVIILIIGIVSVRAQGGATLVDERLIQYERDFEAFTPGEGDDAERPGALEAAGERLDRVLGKRTFGQTWRRQLARADLKLKVYEYLALHFIMMGVFFLIAYFIIFRFNIIASIIAGFVGLFAPRVYVAQATRRRLIRFENQLPDTLGIWVNALRAGYSVLQAMESIAKDAPDPTSTEFRRVVQEVALGIDMEDALEHLHSRVESDDLDMVITAVNIQREVGGNLAEILDVISGTIRERIKLKGEIRVLTAQGRITGYLIGGLPIALALFLYTIQPSYMGQLFENRTCGWPMVGVGLALIGVGQAIIQRIVDVEI